MKFNASSPRPNDQLEHALLAAWSTQADVGICVVDESLRVVMLNTAVSAMLGIDSLAMLNEPFVKLVAAVEARDAEAACALIERHMERAKTYWAEVLG